MKPTDGPSVGLPEITRQSLMILPGAKDEQDLDGAGSLSCVSGEELLDFLGAGRRNANRIIGQNQSDSLRRLGSRRFSSLWSLRSFPGEGIGHLFFGFLAERLGDVHAQWAL